MAKASGHVFGGGAAQVCIYPGRRLLGMLLATLVVAVSLGLLLASSSWAEESSRTYDKAGVTHNEQCIKTSGNQSVVVRDVEGNQLQTSAGAVTDPPEAKEDCSGGAGVRFEGIESVTAKGMTMYYTWPLEGGRQAPGFVWVNELASRPSLNGGDAAGNGGAAPPASGEPAYKITPEDIASEQRYKGPSTGQWYTYSVYGRPVGGAKFALMTWSWIDVGGGGIARAAVSEGETFYPASVQPISLQSSSGEKQPVNGTVTARYGYVNNGTEKVYGWMVTSHTFNGSCYNNMGYTGGGTPLPSTLCPGPVTGSASSVAPQQAILNGLVTPNGSDTHYYFQYGTTPNYGSTQPALPGGDAGSTGTVPVSTTLSLSPGVTYHYRLVVTNIVGTVYGSEQIFTTPCYPPEATTSAATSVQQTQATVDGTVNPQGCDTKYYYQYGQTMAYGLSTPEDDAGAGTSGMQVPTVISGLEPGTIYHYHIVAKSAGGVVEGSDETFTTPLSVSVFFNEPGSTIGELYGNGSTWSYAAYDHLIAPETSPSVVYDNPTGDLWVDFNESDNMIGDLNWNGSIWGFAEYAHLMAPATSPAVVRSASTGEQWIFFTESDDTLGELQGNGSGWNYYAYDHLIAPGTSPAVVRDPTSGEIWVYFNESDNMLGELKLNGSSSSFAEYAHAFAPKTSPAVVRSASTGEQWIFFTESDDTLGELQGNGSGWNYYAYDHLIAPGTSPAVVRDPTSGEIWVYFNESDNMLGEFAWNGSQWGFAEYAHAIAPRTSPAAVRDPSTKEQWVYFNESDNMLGEFYWNGSSWTFAEQAHEISPDTSPAMVLAAAGQP